MGKPAGNNSYLKMTEDAYSRALAQALSGQICVVDKKGYFLGTVSGPQANDIHAEAEHAHAKSVRDLYPDDPQLSTDFMEHIDAAFREKNTQVYRYEATSPHKHKVRQNEAQFTYLDEDKVLFINRNITPIIELSSRVYTNQAILKAVIENNTDMIFALDLDKRYILFNPAHKKSMKLRYDADIEIGVPMTDYVAITSDMGLGLDIFRKVMQGESVMIESNFGNQSMFRGYTQLHVFPLRDEHNRIFGISVFAKDVSAQHQLQQQKENYIRMMEYLVSDLSHKLRKPVATILGLVQLIDEEKDVKDLRKILSYLRESTAEMDECIHQMTQFLEEHTRNEEGE